MENKNFKCPLWFKQSKNGLKYAKGKVVIDNKTYYAVLFNNKDKKSEKSPDFTLILQ